MLNYILDMLQNIPGDVAFWGVIGVLIICGLGLPLPEEIPLFVSGYLVYTEYVSLSKAIIFSTAAIVIGDCILFTIGYRFGPSIFQSKFVSRFLKEKTLNKVNEYFHKYGNRVVFVARFMAGVRAPVFLMAGVLRMPFQRFLLLDGIAALISAPLIVWATYHFCNYFGGETDQALKLVRNTERWILAFVVIAITTLSLFIYKKQKSKTITSKNTDPEKKPDSVPMISKAESERF